MSIPNPGQDALLPVTSQSHNSSHSPSTSVKDDALVTADSRR